MRPPDDLTEFIASHHARLVGVAALSTGDHHHAEDIAQETWVRLCQHWDRVRAGSDPWPYTVAIALNVCRSRWRRLRVRLREVPQIDDVAAPEVADDYRVSMLDGASCLISPISSNASPPFPRRRRPPTGLGARRHTALTVRVAAAVAVAGVAVATLSVRDGHQLRPTDSASASTASAVRTPVVPVPTYASTVGSEHALSWQQLTSPSFDLTGYSYVGTLTDGRLVLWNGTEPMEAVDTPRAVRLAFFDETTGEWAQSAPFPIDQQFGNDAELSVNDHIVVHQYDNGDARGNRFEVYDPATDAWSVSPELESAVASIEWAYDGTTLAALTRPAFGYVSAMTLYRWEVGSSTWVAGATPPLGVRGWPGLTHAGALLAV